MNRKKLAAVKAFGFVLSGVFLASSAHGFSSGSTMSCDVCHGGGADAQITLSGPAEVLMNSTHTFTLTITGGPAMVGGMTIFVDAGILGALDPDTTLSGSDIIHTSPRAFSANTVSWDFDWTAPDVLGAVDLMAFGLSANGANGAAGDFFGHTSFTVQVVPIPAALVLFSSALGLLGISRRRRAA